MESETIRPRVTEAETLRKLVAQMKSKGYNASQIQADLIRVAVVDLDMLNEALSAA
jgi:hypothetical protein